MLKLKKITRPNGLKAEDCAVFAQAAGKFQSAVNIIKNGKKINAKSVMGLISLNIKKDEHIYLDVRGEDEAEAMAKLYPML